MHGSDWDQLHVHPWFSLAEVFQGQHPWFSLTEGRGQDTFF